MSVIMKLTNDLQAPSTWIAGQKYRNEGEQTNPAEEEAAFEEPAEILELSLEALRKDAKDDAVADNFSVAERNNKKSDIEDASGRLTRMLVSAKSSIEVQNVLSQAYKNLGDALTAAASGDDKAMEVVRRLNRLIRRANRKIRDLSKEDETRIKQKRAEKKKLEQLSKQLKDELKRKIAERKQRERKYLTEPRPQNSKPKAPAFDYSVAALEAKMRMMEFAHKMAQISADPAAPGLEPSGSAPTAGESEASADEAAE